MNDTAIPNRAIRAVLDHYREHGEAGWLRGEGPAKGAQRNPIELVVDFGGEDDSDAREAAFDALLFACPGVTDHRALDLWCAHPDRTFAEVLAMVETANDVLNGGPTDA